jgi:glycosyltransferase involved in cell wall biosynthesis
MRILFLATWHPNPPDNGSRIRVYHLLKALGERYEVDLVSFSFGTAKAGLGPGLESACRSVVSVPIDPFEANKAPAYSRFMSMAPVVTRPIAEMQRLTRRILAETVFDTVIVSGAVMENYTLDTPDATFRTLEEHNSLSRLMYERYRRSDKSIARWRYWISWQKARRYERRSFRRYDLVTLASEQDKVYSEQLVHERQARVRVIPNGVDCARNKVDRRNEVKDRLIYNGSMTYRPNFEAVQYFLRQIYPRIKSSLPGVTFNVTGSYEGVELGDLRLDESVRLTGYVEDVRSEVASAAVCVVPLHEGGGTRLKILEAMALGTPVVSTSKGAEGLMVTAGQHLLIADEPQVFAQETLRLLQDEILRRNLARNGRQLVEEKYDWRCIGREYVDLVQQMTEQKKRSNK